MVLAPGEKSAPVTVPDPIVGDNVEVAAVTSDHQAGAAFPVGKTKVVFTASDPSGNTANCTVLVTVLDFERPVITCPAHPNELKSMPELDCAAHVAVLNPATSDNVGVRGVTATVQRSQAEAVSK